MNFKNKKVGVKKAQPKRKYNTKKRIKFRRRCIFLGIVIGSFLVIAFNLSREFWQDFNHDLEPKNLQSVNLSTLVNKPLKNDSVASSGIVSAGTIREVTMYTSEPKQTDNSPCIGASGQDQCVLWRNGQNICATNAYPKGTVLNIQGLGDCLVMDRMNSKFKNRIDWYAGYDDDCLDNYQNGDNCPNLERAIKFGLQSLLVTKK